MRAALLTCLLLGLTVSGCKKKTSAEYYRLEGEHSVLVTRDGEDAYESAEMETILTGLRAVPEDAVEKPKADALIATITAEQARLKKEAAPKNAPTPTEDVNARYEALKAARIEELEAADAGATDPGVDAGPPEPWKGMSEADFLKLYGECFTRGEPVPMGDAGIAASQQVNDDAKCQAKHGTSGATTRWLFLNGGLLAKLVETSSSRSSSETKVLDAGRPAPPPPPPAEEPERPVLVIPGAPVSPKAELDSGAMP